MDGVQKGRRKQFRVIKSETLSPRLTCHPMSRRVGCKLQSAVGVLHHKSLYNSALHDYYVLLAFSHLHVRPGLLCSGETRGSALLTSNWMWWKCFCARADAQRAYIKRASSLPSQLASWVLPLFTFSSLVCSERREDFPRDFFCFSYSVCSHADVYGTYISACDNVLMSMYVHMHWYMTALVACTLEGAVIILETLCRKWMNQPSTTWWGLSPLLAPVAGATRACKLERGAWIFHKAFYLAVKAFELIKNIFY